jgi:hypothetical protein
VPIIFKTVPLRATWAQGQHRIQPIQCLNGAFQSRRRIPLH